MFKQGLASCLFLTTWVGLAFGSDGEDGPAAMVNGEKISIRHMRETLLFVNYERASAPSKEERLQFWKTCLDLAIDDALLQQFLTRKGVKLDPQDLRKRLEELDWPLRFVPPVVPPFVATELRWVAYVRSLPDPQLKSYYDTHKFIFDKVQVRASHIAIWVPPDVSAEERQKAKIKLEKIREQIVAGKIEFAAAARKYSTCPSKSKDGDIGFFSYLDVWESFAKAAFGLKSGDISDVVATADYGWHIIKVTDRSKGEPSDFEEIKESVRAQYEQELRTKVLRNQRRTARIKIYPVP